MRIAALDDDPSQLDLVQRTVRAIGHDCTPFDHGEALLRALKRDTFDLLIVDWQLPDLQGIEIVRWARAHLAHRVPIVFVTNRGDERDIVEGLTSGADDYMVKPIRVHELMARVNALLRRSYPDHDSRVHQHGGFRFDTVARAVTFEGEPIELKQKEFDLARCLFNNPGRLMSRAHLMEAVWGVEVDLPSRSLDTHVSALRAKMNLRPARGFRLTAVYGQGYRLEPVASDDDDPVAAMARPEATS